MKFRWIPISLIIVQCLKTWTWFRDIDLSSAYPIVNKDYLWYYIRALNAHDFFTQSGRMWGYNPFLSAGTPDGPLDMGTTFLSTIGHFFSGVLSIRSTLLFVEIMSFALVPLLMLPIVRNWGGSWKQAWIAFAVTVFTYGVYEPFSVGFMNVGLFGFQMSVFVALWVVSLFYRWILDRSWKMWAGWTVGLGGPLFDSSFSALDCLASVVPVLCYLFQKNQ